MEASILSVFCFTMLWYCPQALFTLDALDRQDWAPAGRRGRIAVKVHTGSPPLSVRSAGV